MTRQYDADILITQFTYERVEYDVTAEPLGFLPVKGRKDPVAVYRVHGLKEDAIRSSAWSPDARAP